MKKITKILAVTAALVLALACFTACSNDDNGGGEKNSNITMEDIPSVPTFAADKKITCNLGDYREIYVFDNETSGKCYLYEKTNPGVQAQIRAEAPTTPEGYVISGEGVSFEYDTSTGEITKTGGTSEDEKKALFTWGDKTYFVYYGDDMVSYAERESGDSIYGDWTTHFSSYGNPPPDGTTLTINKNYTWSMGDIDSGTWEYKTDHTPPYYDGGDRQWIFIKGTLMIEVISAEPMSASNLSNWGVIEVE